MVMIGCSGLQKQLEPPRTSLTGIQIQQVTPLESSFLVKLRIINTNDVDLEVNGLSFDIEINDEQFATGVSNTSIKIPSYGTEILPVVVYSSVLDMFKSVRGLQKNEQLAYRLKGKLRLGGASSFPSSLPFSSEGKISMTRATDSE
jgi:LEA14-like dessication related protein